MQWHEQASAPTPPSKRSRGPQAADGLDGPKTLRERNARRAAPGKPPQAKAARRTRDASMASIASGRLIGGSRVPSKSAMTKKCPSARQPGKPVSAAPLNVGDARERQGAGGG